MRLVLKQGRVIILDELVIIRVSPLTSRADLPLFLARGLWEWETMCVWISEGGKSVCFFQWVG